MGHRIAIRYLPSDDPEVIKKRQASAAWFNDKLRSFNCSQVQLAQHMVAAGDTRQFSTILRNVSSMANSKMRITGEMRAFLCELSEQYLAKHSINQLNFDLKEVQYV